MKKLKLSLKKETLEVLDNMQGIMGGDLTHVFTTQNHCPDFTLGGCDGTNGCGSQHPCPMPGTVSCGCEEMISHHCMSLPCEPTFPVETVSPCLVNPSIACEDSVHVCVSVITEGC